MTTNMRKYEEIWAVSFDRICDFFEAQPGCRIDIRGKYILDDLEIVITPMPEKAVKSLRFPQTRVSIAGENTEKLIRAFELQFFSAGG